MNDQKPSRSPKKFLLGSAGVLVAILLYIVVPGAAHPQAPVMAAIVGLMAMWWIFEVVPIPITSLLPLFLFPAFSILDIKATGVFYGKPMIFLFLGGILLALGLQRSGLHRRIALSIVSKIGSRPSAIVLGMMISTGFLSAWISNTASVMVMMPICLSILEEAKERGVPGTLLTKFGTCVMLGIAYSADIGGMSTLVGTPPNMVFMEMYTSIFPDAPEIGFLEWMAMGVPLAVTFIASGWLLLTKVVFRLPQAPLFGDNKTIPQLLINLGPMRRDEAISGLIFGITALLWMTGSDLNLGASFTLHGWRHWLNLGLVNDGAVAIGAATLLFMVPSQDRQGETLVTWEEARKIPWGILLLFGGGFAIAGGFQATGLSDVVGDMIGKMGIESPILVLIIVCTLLTFLTEITSNTATTNLILPILAKASVVLGIDPRLLMIPATLSASCAFMMPIASPTQAIIFGSGYVNIKQMMRAGIWFNLLGILIITVVFLLIGCGVFGIELGTLPEWAK